MNTTATPIPRGFWPQIAHQLDRIATERADTFDKVRAILTDPQYDAVQADINRNGPRTFGPDAAFFAGSGGDHTLATALAEANWVTIAAKASYHYAMRHVSTGDTLTYTEGDVERGVRL